MTSEPRWVRAVLEALAERQSLDHPGSIVEVVNRETGEVRYTAHGGRLTIAEGAERARGVMRLWEP